MQDLLLTYSAASKLSSVERLNLSYDLSLVSQETAPKTAAVIDLLTIIQDPNFDAQLFNI